jgi:hypothetical protein
MKIKIYYKEDRLEEIQAALEDLEIEIELNKDSFSADVSDEQFATLAEIPGITSVEKVGIFDIWKLN